MSPVHDFSTQLSSRRGPLSAVLVVTLAFVSFSVTSGSTVASEGDTWSLELKENWAIRSTTLVDEDGKLVSTAGFASDNWYPTSVPTTVLSALVANGVYQNPYVGTNNMRIPDSSDEFNTRHDLLRYSHLPNNENPWKDPYWYRKEFFVPNSYEGKQIWLSFEGINYRADVWLNGFKVASSENMRGMFRRFRFNVTDYVSFEGKNCLAVLIHPVDYPGTPAEPQTEALGPFGPNGGSPPKEIGKNVTMQCSAGWDWIPAVRDRNMGIWQDVSLSVTGPVDIRHPHVVTDLPLPETSPASLGITVGIANVSGTHQEGVLKGSVSPEDCSEEITFRRTVELSPGEEKSLSFSPANYPQLKIAQPHLWWPNTYGEQNLYDLTLTFEIDEEISDLKSTTFGIREVESDVPPGKGRVFRVNGKEVFLKGGAWVPDMMLNRDKERYFEEIRLLSEANNTVVRLWGGGIAPPDEFYEACDRFGLLVWQDFWITGDCNGRWEDSRPNWSSPEWPLDHDLFLACAADTVRRIRNHPSLLLWCGGNEMYPCENIYVPLRDKILSSLDGTRPFLPCSGYGDPKWAGVESGVYSGGPWHWIEPRSYFYWVRRDDSWKFKDEVGIPSLPTLDSLEKFIPDLTPQEGEPFPLNDTWGYHDACEGNGKYSLYHDAIVGRYGEPSTLLDYVLQAQLVNANAYRAIFEAVNHRMWDRTSGVVLWKANSAWPSVVWQLYDWYLKPSAGYYYAKKACEPLHVQLNDDSSVSIVNTTHENKGGLRVTVEVFSPEMSLTWENEREVDMGANSCEEVLESIKRPLEELIYFVKLELRDNLGNPISSNFYWRSSINDFTGLRALPSVDLDVSTKTEAGENECVVHVFMENPTEDLAFFIEVSLLDNEGKEEILPTFWSSNYFSILPGENKKIDAAFDPEDLDGARPLLKVDGWNMEEEGIVISEGVTPEGYRIGELLIDPEVAEPGENVVISAEVTRVDEGENGCSVSLFINNELEETKTVSLSEESSTVRFVTSRVDPGVYSIKVNGLSGSFEVREPERDEVLHEIWGLVLLGLLVTVAGAIWYWRRDY